MLVDVARRLIDIVEAQRLVARQVQDDAARAVEALADQRAVNGLLDGLYRAARAAPDAEQGIARRTLAEDRRDIREVDVDDARRQDQLCHAVDGLLQDAIGAGERLDERHVAVLRQFHEVVIGHEDQRVHLGLHLREALIGQALLAAALEAERQRDDADRERPEVVRDLGDDRRRPCASTTAEAGRDKDEICAVHRFADLILCVEGRLLAERDVAARAASLRQVLANLQRLDAFFCHARELLGIGIDGDQIDVEFFMMAHAHQDAVAATANTEYLDLHFRLYD